MKAIDFRNLAYDEIRDRLLDSEWRSKVYHTLLQHGPATTRRIAEILQREVHTIRPRFTELKDHGFVDLVPGQEVTADGGIYFARTPEEFAAWRETLPKIEPNGQVQLI